MLLSNLKTRKRKNSFLITLLTIILVSIFSSEVYAESMTPISTESTLSQGDRSQHSITIENENNYDIYLTPKIYKYYPQSEYISDPQEFEELVIIDTDYITIPSNATKDIPFQVVAPKALDLGTYYNLIVFQPTQQKEDDATIGATGGLSHLVKVNIVENPYAQEFTDDYDMHFEVTDRGIPFIKPAKLKLTFFNNSEYTLSPIGEIQIVKKSQNKEPEYIKINLDRTKTYPQETYEKEYEVKNWYIEDIIFGKTAYLKLQNGLDEKITTSEVKIPGFKNELLYILATVTIVILMATSLKTDAIPEQEYVE
jgi:hypothetical protein